MPSPSAARCWPIPTWSSVSAAGRRLTSPTTKDFTSARKRATPIIRSSPGSVSGKLPDAAQLELLVTRVMPFGKYKGTLIADLPGNYLNWFAREGFPPGEIGRLLALMHEVDHNGLSRLLDPLRQPRLPARK
ncbi:MAG: DUF3820 family protein [Dechloromonas sp.]|nr:DUF3820 family protein [Dechloromonas sp.]